MFSFYFRCRYVAKLVNYYVNSCSQLNFFIGGLEYQLSTYFVVLHHHQRNVMDTQWQHMIGIFMCMVEPLDKHCQMTYTGQQIKKLIIFCIYLYQWCHLKMNVITQNGVSFIKDVHQQCLRKASGLFTVGQFCLFIFIITMGFLTFHQKLFIFIFSVYSALFCDYLL